MGVRKSIFVKAALIKTQSGISKIEVYVSLTSQLDISVQTVMLSWLTFSQWLGAQVPSLLCPVISDGSPMSIFLPVGRIKRRRGPSFLYDDVLGLPHDTAAYILLARTSSHDHTLSCEGGREM